jgi:hypothetical protein
METNDDVTFGGFFGSITIDVLFRHPGGRQSWDYAQVEALSSRVVMLRCYGAVVRGWVPKFFEPQTFEKYCIVGGRLI